MYGQCSMQVSRGDFKIIIINGKNVTKLDS